MLSRHLCVLKTTANMPVLVEMLRFDIILKTTRYRQLYRQKFKRSHL